MSFDGSAVTREASSIFRSLEESVTDVSKQIARDLREQYTLEFQPEKTNIIHPFRKIEVKVAAPGHGKIRVRTERGYFRRGAKGIAYPL